MDERPNIPGNQTPKKSPTDDRRKSLLPLLFVVGVIVLMVMLLSPNGKSDYTQINVGKFRSLVTQPADKYPIKSVTRVGDEEYRGELYPHVQETFEGQPFRRFRVPIASEAAAKEYASEIDPVLSQRLGASFSHERAQTRLTSLLMFILPWIILIGLLWFMFFRRMGPGGVGGGNIFGFTRSRARMHSKESVNVSFKDVAGIDEAREDVQELIQFLKNPEKFRRIGGRIPRGVLLIGPPGCGKTLLAKAVAGEANVPFFSISGSDFVEMFVGVGASRVRDLFRQAKENSPCIIFLDEIDAVGRRRGTGLGGGHDEREQTLNAILVEMDGFDTDQGIIVVAATNRPDVLDPALLRPGRFDRQITIDLPDVRGREKIFDVHVKKVKISSDVNIAKLARGTPGFSGAEIANMVNEAAIIAAMAGKDVVDMECFSEARDKVKFGRQKKSRVMPEKELKVTAYHEAGHAVVQYFLPETDPLYKVTIIPRGMAGGATMSLPEEDRHYANQTYLNNMLAVFFAGRAAESIIFNEVTTGASNDIKRATELARHMVCEWGMSEKVGPMNYSDSEEHMFLGREIARTTNHGPEVAKLIDEETRRLVQEAETTAFAILNDKRDKLELLAQALLEFETLMAEEILPLLDGEMTLEQLRQVKPASPRRIQSSAKDADTGADLATDSATEAGDLKGAGEKSVDAGQPGLPVPKALGGGGNGSSDGNSGNS